MDYLSAWQLWALPSSVNVASSPLFQNSFLSSGYRAPEPEIASGSVSSRVRKLRTIGSIRAVLG